MRLYMPPVPRKPLPGGLGQGAYSTGEPLRRCLLRPCSRQQHPPNPCRLGLLGGSGGGFNLGNFGLQ